MEDLKEISTIDLVNELKHRRCVGFAADLMEDGYSHISITVEVLTSQVGEIFNTKS